MENWAPEAHVDFGREATDKWTLTDNRRASATFSLSACTDGMCAGIQGSTQASRAAGGLRRTSKNGLLVDVCERMWRQKVFSSGRRRTFQDDQKLQRLLFSDNDCRVHHPYNDRPFDTGRRVAVVGGA